MAGVKHEQIIKDAELALRKKKQCLSLAVKTVERLLENSTSQQELLESCRYINKSYLKDVMEERGIILRCGYPLCTMKLDKIPNQKYHISLKYNKIFELEERKYFCSNFCYKAFKYLEAQLPSCPLWLLEQETPKDINLLYNDTVDLKSSTKHSTNEQTSNDVELRHAVSQVQKNEDHSEIDKYPVVASKVDLVTEDFNKLTMTTKTNSKSGSKAPRTVSLSELVKSVEDALSGWITPKTVHFLLDSAQCNEWIQSKSTNFDCKLISPDSSKNNSERKTIPSYNEMLSDDLKGRLNIQAFLNGRMEVIRSQHVIENADKEDAPKDESNDDVSYFAPLIDSRSQNALRCRIVLEKLNKMNFDILDMLKISRQLIPDDYRQLIHTFRLHAKNISFKPQEWMLIALLIIKMLAMFKEKVLNDALSVAFSKNVLQRMLQTFKLDEIYLESACVRLLDTAIDQMKRNGYGK